MYTKYGCCCHSKPDISPLKVFKIMRGPYYFLQAWNMSPVQQMMSCCSLTLHPYLPPTRNSPAHHITSQILSLPFQTCMMNATRFWSCSTGHECGYEVEHHAQPLDWFKSKCQTPTHKHNRGLDMWLIEKHVYFSGVSTTCETPQSLVQVSSVKVACSHTVKFFEATVDYARVQPSFSNEISSHYDAAVLDFTCLWLVDQSTICQKRCK